MYKNYGVLLQRVFTSVELLPASSANCCLHSPVAYSTRQVFQRFTDAFIQAVMRQYHTCPIDLLRLVLPSGQQVRLRSINICDKVWGPCNDIHVHNIFHSIPKGASKGLYSKISHWSEASMQCRIIKPAMCALTMYPIRAKKMQKQFVVSHSSVHSTQY